ncbi:hypothetical protein ACIBG7_43150 [Nonomuraea sp. NPDC050328]|uniref:hypothetical protein n=1 Tax=Nonomuraea sp. NPDC050328 TaxID=3364361 RepID=UPI0037AB477E
MLDDLQRHALALGLKVSRPYRVALGWDLNRLAMDLAIGRWRRAPTRNWGRARRTLARLLRSARHRSYWAIWQCEEETLGLSARRGLTARAAERRMLADAITHALSSRP